MEPFHWQIVNKIKIECPNVPLVLYINGNGGLLERMTDTGVDVIGLDWTVDMADGRRRLGNKISVQGNVDPAFLFSPLPVLTDEIHRLVKTSLCIFIFCSFKFLILTFENASSVRSPNCPHCVFVSCDYGTHIIHLLVLPSLINLVHICTVCASEFVYDLCFVVYE